MHSETPEGQKAFYKTKRWQRCRAAYASSVGGLCERCQAKGIIRPGYIVHHKEYITPENLNNPNISLSFDNLELLCMDCHNQEHFARKKRYKVKPDGTVLVLDPPENFLKK